MTSPNLFVYPAPSLVDPIDLSGCVAVVIDVLRATTTIAHALDAGCPRIYPVADIDEARHLASTLHSENPLLGGERQGERIDGFDLGNSPREYTPEHCLGRPLVMTTTNGTRTLARTASADRVVTAAFVNLKTVCEHLRAESGPIHIVCAGKEGAIALEDVLLAGAVVEELALERTLDDGARLALAGYQSIAEPLVETLKTCAGGVPLLALGYDEDIRWAARRSVLDVLPVLRRDAPHPYIENALDQTKK